MCNVMYLYGCVIVRLSVVLLFVCLFVVLCLCVGKTGIRINYERVMIQLNHSQLHMLYQYVDDFQGPSEEGIVCYGGQGHGP